MVMLSVDTRQPQFIISCILINIFMGGFVRVHVVNPVRLLVVSFESDDDLDSEPVDTICLDLSFNSPVCLAVCSAK